MASKQLYLRSNADGVRKNFNFYTNKYADMVTKQSLPAANYETVHTILHGSELITYGTDEYVRDAQGNILTFGAYTQLCLYSEDPIEWGGSLAFANLSPINNIGPFNACTITDTGVLWSRVRIWESDSSGSPSGALFGRIYYKAGTSNSLMLVCRDNDESLQSLYEGVIDEASVITEAAGALTIIKDLMDNSIGCRILEFVIDFINKENDLNIQFGPFSTDNSNIIILGADVFDTSTWRPHTPSSGSTVSVSATKYDYNAGTPRGPRFALADLPGVIDGVNGSVVSGPYLGNE